MAGVEVEAGRSLALHECVLSAESGRSPVSSVGRTSDFLKLTTVSENLRGKGLWPLSGAQIPLVAYIDLIFKSITTQSAKVYDYKWDLFTSWGENHNEAPLEAPSTDKVEFFYTWWRNGARLNPQWMVIEQLSNQCTRTLEGTNTGWPIGTPGILSTHKTPFQPLETAPL